MCPVCRLALQEMKLQTQLVDRCPQCNGIYFDQGELEVLVKLIRIFGQVELGERDIDTIPTTEKERTLACPSDGKIMNKENVAGHIIDKCSHCQGIWLDDNEIVALKLSERHIRENLNLYIRLGA
jgi:Zn-finger nucleic acid-binding protein